MKRGEQAGLKKEPGRGNGKAYRSARDSTGIASSERDPIHPAMPHIPPS